MTHSRHHRLVKYSLRKGLTRHLLWVVRMCPICLNTVSLWFYLSGTHRRWLKLPHHRWVLTAHDWYKGLMDAIATICVTSDVGRGSQEILSGAQVVLTIHPGALSLKDITLRLHASHFGHLRLIKATYSRGTAILEFVSMYLMWINLITVTRWAALIVVAVTLHRNVAAIINVLTARNYSMTHLHRRGGYSLSIGKQPLLLSSVVVDALRNSWTRHHEMGVERPTSKRCVISIWQLGSKGLTKHVATELASRRVHHGRDGCWRGNHTVAHALLRNAWFPVLVAHLGMAVVIAWLLKYDESNFILKCGVFK